MCFLIKKSFDDVKKTYLYDRFFFSTQNFTTEHVKLLKIPGFFQVSLLISSFSCKLETLITKNRPNFFISLNIKNLLLDFSIIVSLGGKYV